MTDTFSQSGYRWGTKGFSRPTCIGTVRARPPLAHTEVIVVCILCEEPRIVKAFLNLFSLTYGSFLLLLCVILVSLNILNERRQLFAQNFNANKMYVEFAKILLKRTFYILCGADFRRGQLKDTSSAAFLFRVSVKPRMI
jgi:hypothetical protein